MSLVLPMGPVCGGYIPGPPRNQIPPLVSIVSSTNYHTGQGGMVQLTHA